MNSLALGGSAMQLLQNSTVTALWHDIIHEAEEQCDIQLKEDVESYLVYLLIRYTEKPQCLNTQWQLKSYPHIHTINKRKKKQKRKITTTNSFVLINNCFN